MWSSIWFIGSTSRFVQNIVTYLHIYAAIGRQILTSTHTRLLLVECFARPGLVGLPRAATLVICVPQRHQETEARKSHLFSGSTEVGHGCWSQDRMAFVSAAASPKGMETG